MRKLLLFVFLLSAVHMSAQKYNWKRAGIVAGFGVIGGVAYGTHETAVHKPWNFPSSWNPQYWNASKSWTNKYWHGDKANGPKFPGSTGPLVMFTDAKHLSSTIHRAALIGAGMTIGLGERRPIWHYAVDLCIGFAAYSLGFHACYTYSIWTRK